MENLENFIETKKLFSKSHKGHPEKSQISWKKNIFTK